MVHMCKNDNISRCFFQFFKILIFQVVRGWGGGGRVKRQKTVQNDKKFCRSRFISQEPYITWLRFMVHICKMIISPGFFIHFFKIFIFWVVRGVKGQKVVQNDKKFCPSRFISLEPYIIWLSFMVQMCKMMDNLKKISHSGN